MARDFAKSFYASKAWKQCRQYVWDREFGICQDCGKPGEEVHHEVFLKAESMGNPEITLNPKLLSLLCRDCHYTRHTKRRKSIDDCYYFDEDGNMQRKET